MKNEKVATQSKTSRSTQSMTLMGYTISRNLFVGVVSFCAIAILLAILLLLIGTDQEDIQKQDLQAVEKSEYTFYYPSDFVKYDNPVQEEAYKSDGDISPLNIGVVATNNGLEYEDYNQTVCEDEVNKVTFLIQGQIISVDYLQRNEIRGCIYEISGKLEGAEIKMYIKEFAKLNEPRVYSVNATYNTQASVETVELLKQAVESFEINR